jgi:hypothetical protein
MEDLEGHQGVQVYTRRQTIFVAHRAQVLSHQGAMEDVEGHQGAQTLT